MSKVIIQKETTSRATISAPGIQGPPGEDGIGIPDEGTTGQILAKASNDDYDTEWVNPPSGGGGAVDSVNGQTGVVVLDKDDIGLGNVDNTSDVDKPVSTAVTTELNSRDTANRNRANHTGTQSINTVTNLETELQARQNTINTFNQAILYQASATAGDIQGVPNWARNARGGFDRFLPVTTDDGGFKIVNNNLLNITHAENSNNEQYVMHFSRFNLDVGNDGFNLGTNGRSVLFHDHDVQSTTNAYIGSIDFIANNFTVGDGVVAKNVRGFSYSYGFGTIRENVTITAPMQGYGYQPSFESGTFVDEANAFTQVFYDGVNAPDTIFSFYTTFNCSPNLGGIANDRNFSALNINPTIGDFQGNASYFGINLAGNLGDFDTGFFQGLNINTSIDKIGNANGIAIGQTITECDNYSGIFVDVSNVTATGSKFAGNFNGDVNINGNLNFSGALSIGQLDAFFQTNPVDGGGLPLTIHGLISGMTALNGETTDNADAIGVNTAMLVTLEEDSTTTSGPFGLGFTALALPCVVVTEPNSYLDFMSGTTAAINLDASSTGGEIDTIKVNRSVVIPNGVTQINNLRGFQFDLPFGDPANVTHGFYTEVDCDNYFRGALVIGEDSEVRANSSVGLEIASTTKAFMNSRMTTTQRDALTASFGMQIANSDTNKLQFYDGTSWVDLH